MTRVLKGMRNKLIFHWDDEPIREFVTKYAKPTVTWADGTGDTQGESFYRAAADSLTNSVLPDDPAASAPETPERSMERLGELMREVLPATDRVLELFDFAIIGHVKSHGAKLRSGRAS